MNEIIFKNNIKLGRRKLLVETLGQADQLRAEASVYDGDNLVEKQEKKFLEAVVLDEQRFRVQEFHKKTIDNLELLFFMANKISEMNHPDSFHKIALVFLKHNFIDEAIEAIRSAIKLRSDRGGWYNVLGVAYYKQNELSKAADAFHKGIEKNSAYPDIHYHLGFCYWKMHRFVEAIAAVRKAISINVNYAEAIFTLGLILLDSSAQAPKEVSLPPPIERTKEAVALIRKALELGFECDIQQVEKGLNRVEEQKIDQAVTEILAAKASLSPKIKLAPETEFYTKFMFGGFDKDDEMVNEHIKMMMERINQNPNYADLHYDLAIAYLIKARNQFINALDEFQQAVELNPAFEKAKRSLKLVENDGRGMLILLRALLK